MLEPLPLSGLALLFGLLSFASAGAAEPDACRGEDLSNVAGLAAATVNRAADLLNADGLLWRIEKPGLAPSYLYGAIHSTDEAALEVAKRAAAEIKTAKVVATELGGPIELDREGQYRRSNAQTGARSRP